MHSLGSKGFMDVVREYPAISNSVLDQRRTEHEFLELRVHYQTARKRNFNINHWRLLNREVVLNATGKSASELQLYGNQAYM